MYSFLKGSTENLTTLQCCWYVIRNVVFLAGFCYLKVYI